MLKLEPASPPVATAPIVGTIPFDAAELDRLMTDAGLDAVIVSSPHNLFYLMGGYKFFFFDRFQAIGTSRYLPLFVYRRGQAERACYIGNQMETDEQDNHRLWTRNNNLSTWRSPDAAKLAARFIVDLGLSGGTIGFEPSFLPADVYALLTAELPDARLLDAAELLEELRARKSPRELDLLREASDRVIGAMKATFGAIRPGMSKQEIADVLRAEEQKRGLDFEYCLISSGTSFNRAPNSVAIEIGDILSVDSGAAYHGYVGDLARMAVLGREPDAELVDLLAMIEEVQLTARRPIRAGARGRDIYDAVEPLLRRAPRTAPPRFVAHGMGLITHEAPRLTDTGPVPYAARHRERALEAGMVISIETTLLHERRGFIKLEDTIAVTADGSQAFGDDCRPWTVIPA